MATLQSAKEKYARKTANAASAWNAAKVQMSSRYAEGVARFLGSPPSGRVMSNYSAGIQAAQYRGGDPNRWAEGYTRAMTGG